MFNNFSFETKQKAIGDEWQRLEEEMKIKVADTVLKSNKWKTDATKKIETLTKQFTTIASRNANVINKETVEGVKQAIDLSKEEVLRLNIDTQVVEETSDYQLKVSLGGIALENAKTATALVNGVMSDYTRLVAKLKDDDLFEQIVKYVDDFTRSPTIIYIDNKRMSFRSYAEMRVRTDLNRAALSNLEASAKAAGAGYFLASEHFDCADDHAEYQGKFYLADGVIDEWNGKYMYLSEAKRNGFLTRPNCRHYVTPVTKEQLGDVKLLDELGMRKGHYKKENYDTLVEQRRNERAIREFKMRANTAELAYNRSPDEASKKILGSEKAYYNAKVKEWQARQRKTLKGTTLKRDYRRETPGIVIDGGVKLQKKYGLK